LRDPGQRLNESQQELLQVQLKRPAHDAPWYARVKDGLGRQADSWKIRRQITSQAEGLATQAVELWTSHPDEVRHSEAASALARFSRGPADLEACEAHIEQLENAKASQEKEIERKEELLSKATEALEQSEKRYYGLKKLE
jgi:hypothetical protein